MAEASIPVDPFNPGQVFACIGLVDAADTLLGDAEGAFDWSDAADVRFRVRASGASSPVDAVLAFLGRARAVAVAPEGSANVAAWKSTWGDTPASVARADGYPFPDPPSPATLVCVLDDGRDRLVLGHWGDGTRRDNVKFWAGAAGYPAAALARDALLLAKGRITASFADPFAISGPQDSSFRLDWRRDYIPIDAGFSVNAHAAITPIGYPVVELLAAIGLENARPRRSLPTSKLSYEYGMAGRSSSDDDLWVSPSLLRAALGAVPLPFPMRRFRMLLDWPGQENQARAITTVTEVTA